MAWCSVNYKRIDTKGLPAACRLFSRGVIFTHSRFARSTIPEEKWGTTRSLMDNMDHTGET